MLYTLRCDIATEHLLHLKHHFSTHHTPGESPESMMQAVAFAGQFKLLLRAIDDQCVEVLLQRRAIVGLLRIEIPLSFAALEKLLPGRGRRRFSGFRCI